MYGYTGEDLLKVFSDINIETGNISNNVIKGWFDSNNNDLLNFLNWMCTLSKENYISPHEKFNYESLTEIYKGSKLEEEIEKVEDQYPKIFNINANLFEVNFLEKEIELEKKEQRNVQQALHCSKNLEESLIGTLLRLGSNEIRSSTEKDQAQENCHKLAVKLVECNKELHQEIVNLNEEIKLCNKFINTVALEKLETKLDVIVALLYSESSNFISSLNITTLDQSVHLMNDTKKRLDVSKFNCLMEKIEWEILQAIQNYLNSCNVQKLLDFVEVNELKDQVAEKKNEVESLNEYLKNNCQGMMDQYIFQIKVKNIQFEKDFLKMKLKNIKNVNNALAEIKDIFLVLQNLFYVERMDYNKIENFYKNMFTYISNRLESCVLRTISMNKVIEDYKQNRLKPLQERFKLLRCFMNILQANDLNETLKNYDQIKNKINFMEQELFINDPVNSLVETQEYYNNELYKIKKRLSDGSTPRLVIIPQNLYNCIQKADFLINEQQMALKAVSGIFRNTFNKVKNNEDKWVNKKRHLWVYFLCNPNKLIQIIQEIENEFKTNTSNM